ncbi:protein FAR1-RELATED SEQUENCE 5-like [Hevea brasiliensis]|uniref:protein FAR1-RELATED SEQUENCE 5-like n=1 Tax=Hevea brasiliensis TaxID=3981 RepID=UPI0025FC5E9E|nr:protein FAR1-RELATED SEQUENCE 5-like [Hevea brasiliensis]
MQLYEGMWEVTKTISRQNHDLEPSMCRFMHGHRKLTPNMKRVLEANDRCGIRPSKNIRMLEVEVGGPENLSCLAKDYRNFIENERRLQLCDGDIGAISKLFMTMQQKDHNFLYLMQLDSDNRLCNVLWVHPCGRAAYQEFHDVVSFDTTYLVNRYRMPFATIMGLNHHGQSILLGCVLISHEDADTFKWLFSTWIEAIGGGGAFILMPS